MKDIDALVDQIRDEGVKALFPETAITTGSSRRSRRRRAPRSGSRCWPTASGAKGSAGDTYLEAMAYNTEAMVDGMTAGAVACKPTA